MFILQQLRNQTYVHLHNIGVVAAGHQSVNEYNQSWWPWVSIYSFGDNVNSNSQIWRLVIQIQCNIKHISIRFKAT